MDVRPTQQSDMPCLCEVLDKTQLFPSEMLQDMLAPFLADDPSDEIWLTCHVDQDPVGFCYAAPEQLTDGTWNMLAIAVHPDQQGSGCGAALSAMLERTLRDNNQRILIADTSGTDEFTETRAFYRRQGYSEEARIRDFWAAGDDKVTFWKAL